MEKKAVVDVFEKMGAGMYDESNRKLESIHKNLHFLIKLILQNSPQNANILCVGVGTGADIFELAKTYKGWTFTGVEPSKTMLDGCKEKVKAEKLDDRCDFFHGYLDDFNFEKKYDVVLCLYVMHFVQDLNERALMFKNMAKYLKKDGYLIDAEISCDFTANDYANLLENWKTMHAYGGADPEKLKMMDSTLKQQLSILAPKETEKLIEKSGFSTPTQFFQSLLIRAWYARKK